MLEHSQPAVVLQVHVQPHAVPSLAQDAGQRRLAHLQRLAAQVLTVEFQQVKGVEKRHSLVPTTAEEIEPGQSTLIAAHHLPVDQTGLHLEVVHGLDHEREAV